jgi:hypothetical protein
VDGQICRAQHQDCVDAKHEDTHRNGVWSLTVYPLWVDTSLVLGP